MSERGPADGWQYLCYWEPQGAIDVERTLADLPAGDHDAASLFAAQHSGLLHYLAGSGDWLIWDGTHHKPDLSLAIQRIVMGWARDYRRAVEEAKRQDRAEFLRGYSGQPNAAEAAADNWVKTRWDGKQKFSSRIVNTAGHNALLTAITGVMGYTDEIFDEQHPEWLNTVSGTVSLLTDLVKPHDITDRLTYCLPTAYRPGAPCPLFLALAWSVSGYNQAVFDYLLRVLGYCLLGYNPEQLIFYLCGPTKSGKSQLLYVVREVLGALAHESQATLVTVVRHGRNARVMNSIRGRRLVTFEETSGSMRVDAGHVKRLTGEPVISVDEHYAKREIKTPVTWTIVGTTNQMMSDPDFDEAMGERAVIIPTGPTIPAELRDKHLAARILAAEREGVLALLVAACREYARSGLQAPVEVLIASAAYRTSQDTVANFISECCIRVPPEAFGVVAAIPMTEAWSMYRHWSAGGFRLGRNEFYDHMARQPGVTRVDDGSRKRQFEGIAWNDEAIHRLRMSEDS